MTSKIPFYLSIILLVVAGIALSVFRHQNYGVPWTPGETRQVWDVEARIEFNANGNEVKASLAAPHTQSGYTLIGESASSSGYGVSYINSDSGRRAEWSIRQAKGPQTIYYKAQFLVDPQAKVEPLPPAGDITPPTLSAPQQAAASALIDQAMSRSADNVTFARELIKALNDPDSQNSALLLNDFDRTDAPQQATNNKVEADGLLNLSIHSLPLEEQAMFKTIMLIPIGALIVVFLRVIIGLKTSGTFMPVLIAVAFVQTQLVTGIVGFLLIVGTGLIIRSYLSRLNLLLVARISAVIITVIMIISVFTVVAFKIGLTEGLTITFFPMIILSWTIERMSILWEEEGAKEVAMQGGGSLLTAVLVYLAMTNSYIQHLTFNFIGLQLIVLAGILLLGTYTGYRLTELRRFKPLAED